MEFFWDACIDELLYGAGLDLGWKDTENSLNVFKDLQKRDVKIFVAILLMLFC